MKKVVTILVLLLVLFSFSIVTPATSSDNETNSTSQTTTTTTTSTTSTTPTTSTESVKEKTEAAFICLEEKAGDCSDLTIQEIALVIMATPDNIFNDCVAELEDRKEDDNWGNIKDTGLAIIALEHAGKDTTDAQEWLIQQNQTPTDLIWYLQQDSNSAAECHIGYDSTDYTININEDKKISANAGGCLTRSQSNFWLQISNTCYDQTFSIECDQDFIANLIYKNKNSPTIYVLEGTTSAPAYDSIQLGVSSKCFGDSGCDYESTVWATLALLETKNNVDEFIPYIVAMSETNQRYLPEAYIFILTNYEDYASSLIANQELGNFWQADGTAYNKYYDTGLALLSLSSSTAEQVVKAKDWVFFSQGSNGCWQNSVQDTAMMLWALEGRSGKSSPGGSSVTYCTEANYFCIPSSDCPGTEDVGASYFCPSLSNTCCTTNNLKTCSEYLGQICASDKICTGNSKQALDTNTCCLGSCEERATESECEASYYSCMDSCSEYQEPMESYSCNSLGEVCCRTKIGDDDKGSSLWIWLLIILILIVIGVLLYIYREEVKVYYFKVKTKFKKDDGKNEASSTSSNIPPRGPPRPGFPPRRMAPPMRRPPQQPAAPQKRSYDRRDKSMSDTFKELRDMSK